MMSIQVTESIWLNASSLCSFQQLVDVSGLSREDLQELVDVGAIEPANHDPGNYVFQSECIVIARKARRLRDDFELDMPGLALALRLLQRVDELEGRLNAVRAQTSHPNRP
jgi:chaperone modulatory protein CbpM